MLTCYPYFIVRGQLLLVINTATSEDTSTDHTLSRAITAIIVSLSKANAT
jgi:hypothetical protein